MISQKNVYTGMRLVCLLLSQFRMKSMAFKVVRDGRDYLNTTWVPADHSEEVRPAGAWGFIIVGSALVAAATFVCLLLFEA